MLERLSLRSQQVGECLEWHGWQTSDGYGLIMIDKRVVRVSRAAYAARHGEIPAGLLVLHRCDNPPCWRDEHLFLGTQLDNMRDKVAKGRHRNGSEDQTHCKFGHEFVPGSFYQYGTSRHCRPCALARSAATRAKARAS